MQPGEQCDLGNLNGLPDQLCTITCQIIIATCSNGVIDKGEECDEGLSNGRLGASCNERCQNIQGFCGDKITQIGLGEQCDKGTDFNGHSGIDCDSECRWVKLSQCGDGVIDLSTEQCDDGTANGDYPQSRCHSNCMLPYCNDGITQPNEQCDLGAQNGIPGSGCDVYCRMQSAAAPIGASLLQGDTIPRNIPTPARTPTGPGLVIFLASGAAAGVGLVRRRYLK